MNKQRAILFLVAVLPFCLPKVCAQSPQKLRVEIADEVQEGDGAKVRRLIPKQGLKHYDPYVLFDDFSITPPSGFPDHFHSGFEVITYVVQGQLQHKDSKGNTLVLGPGDVQCFTTGSGVIHSEMPQGTEPVRGFQIWINLPKEDKKIEPGYTSVKAEDLPLRVVNEEVSIKTIVSKDARVRTRAEVFIQEVHLKKQGKYIFNLPTGYRGFVYLASGKIRAEGNAYDAGKAIVFNYHQPISFSADEDSILMLVSGLPLGEPIRRRGSVVK